MFKTERFKCRCVSSVREFFDEIKDGWRSPQYEHKPAALPRPKVQLDWRLKLGRKETQITPYSRYPPFLHALKDQWNKSNVTWFLKGQTSDKICQNKQSRSSLFIVDIRKWRPYYLKDDKDKLWMEMIIVTCMDAVATA